MVTHFHLGKGVSRKLTNEIVVPDLYIIKSFAKLPPQENRKLDMV